MSHGDLRNPCEWRDEPDVACPSPAHARVHTMPDGGRSAYACPQHLADQAYVYEAQGYEVHVTPIGADAEQTVRWDPEDEPAALAAMLADEATAPTTPEMVSVTAGTAIAAAGLLWRLAASTPDADTRQLARELGGRLDTATVVIRIEDTIL